MQSSGVLPSELCSPVCGPAADGDSPAGSLAEVFEDVESKANSPKSIYIQTYPSMTTVRLKGRNHDIALRDAHALLVTLCRCLHAQLHRQRRREVEDFCDLGGRLRRHQRHRRLHWCCDLRLPGDTLGGIVGRALRPLLRSLRQLFGFDVVGANAAFGWALAHAVTSAKNDSISRIASGSVPISSTISPSPIARRNATRSHTCVLRTSSFNSPKNSIMLAASFVRGSTRVSRTCSSKSGLYVRATSTTSKRSVIAAASKFEAPMGMIARFANSSA